MVGCSETTQETVDNTKIEDKKDEGAMVEEEETSTEKDQASTEKVEASTQEEKEEDEEEEQPPVLNVDGLSGLELLQAIKISLPETAISTTESVAADGTRSTATLYTKGENMRTESQSPDMGEQVMIYNAELGEMYVYSVDEKAGIISKDDDDEMDDEADMDIEGEMTYAELMVGEDPSTFEAKVEDLNGEKVVYIHTSSTDEGMEMDIHTWYSMAYMIAMKTEMYINGKLAGSSEVTDIQVNVDIDDQLFEKPEGINLIESLF